MDDADALRGRVNSLYRLVASGMMAIGLVLSGLVVSLCEGTLPREQALVLPFWVAGVGAMVLAAAVWTGIRRGFTEVSG